ncbi:hypothetical protein SAMD00023353_2201560 [Rosellinia necatrix]|uniref:Uncharacterized protein n=1 Tax=Rosellinia necatrix TaxID=77044 RepID=A0A1S8A7R7_ROSNE|nr:hypothetical protein SAMD00023353_2201560 [Rosellinia necatrix]
MVDDGVRTRPWQSYPVEPTEGRSQQGDEPDDPYAAAQTTPQKPARGWLIAVI